MSLSDYEVGAVMATADLKAAREFYEGKLGLKPAEKPSDDPAVPINYVCGKGTAISVYLSPEHAGKSTATMAVRPLAMTSSKNFVGFLKRAAVRALPMEMFAPAANVPSMP